MTLTVVAEPLPIRVDASGDVRVGRSRVPLTVFLGYYNQGRSAEQLAEDFPTISLADAHATISYYLRHKDEVDAYLAEEEAAARALQATIEAEQVSVSWDELRRRAAERGLSVG